MEKVSKTLSRHLSRIQESIARMDDCTDAIPLIERDLLLAELRDLYSAVCQLSTAAHPTADKETEQAENESRDVLYDSHVTPTERLLAAAPTAAIVADTLVPEKEAEEAPQAAAEQPSEEATAETTAPEATTTEEETIAHETDAPEAQTEETAAPQPTEAAPQEELPLTPQADEQPAETPAEEEASPLLIDEDTQPVYAEETEPEEPTTPAEGVPTMEEIEGNLNDTLFDEQEVAAAPAQPQHEQPQTLWDKLQESATAATVGESIAASKTLSDLYLERKQQSAAEQPQPAATTPAPKIEEPQPTPEPEPEPAPAPAPAPEPAPAPAPAPAPEAPAQQRNIRQEASQHQSSLFDYLKQPEPKPRFETPTPTPTPTPATNHTTQGTTTIADAMGHQMGNTTEHKLSSSHVSDLRTIININDKFSFMNELFHNNMKGYNDFILRLNAIASRDEALNYVQQVARQYNWDNESMTVKTFFNIFDRKF